MICPFQGQIVNIYCISNMTILGSNLTNAHKYKQKWLMGLKYNNNYPQSDFFSVFLKSFILCTYFYKTG